MVCKSSTWPPGISAALKRQIEKNSMSLSTSCLFGCKPVPAISGTPGLFDMSAGLGLHVDNTTNPGFPVCTLVDVPERFDQVIDNLATQLSTTLSIDIDGEIIQGLMPLTPSQRRDRFSVGALVHTDNATISNVVVAWLPGFDTHAQLQDLMQALGIFLTGGNEVSAVSGSMELDKAVGTLFAGGVNVDNDLKDPSNIPMPALEPMQFLHLKQDGVIYDFGSVIEPNEYDNNGVMTVLSSDSDATIGYVFIFANNQATFMPGQFEYDSFEAAVEAVGTEVMIIPELVSNAILMVKLVMMGKATDMTNTEEVRVVSVQAASGAGASSGGGAWGEITGTLSDQTDLQGELDDKEDFLDDPLVDGYVLSSTIAGVRSWVEQSGGGGGGGSTTPLIAAQYNDPTGGQSLAGAAGVDVLITIDTADFQDTGYSNVGGVITVVDPGRYRLDSFVSVTGTTANYRWEGRISIYKNTSTLLKTKQGGYIRATNGHNSTFLDIDHTFDLLAGDTLQIMVARTNTTAGDATTVANESQIILTKMEGGEPALGNPLVDDYVLSSKIDGTRSWVANAGGGGGAVDSVFTRTGAVVAVSGDYNADEITETATRVFLTPAEKTEIGVNTGKISYTDAAAVSLNTAKISYTDAAAVALNTAKISYTDAAAVSANTAKISYTDAAAVSLNTAKISYTDAAAVALNTAKISYTDAAAVSANTAKISYTDAAAVSLNTAKISYTDAAVVATNTTNIDNILWTPADLTTEPEGWWDASDTDSITVATGVSQIDDQTSNARNLSQGTGSRQPETGQTLNGLNVITFDHTTFEALVHNTFPIPTSRDISVFTVQSYTAGGGSVSDSLFSMDSSSADWQVAADNVTQFDGRVNSTGMGGAATQNWAGGPFNGPSIYNAYFNRTGNGRGCYVDGAEVTTEEAYTTGMDTPQQFRIMANRANTGSISGILAECIIVEDQSVETRQFIEGYLKWKWNLPALPSGHPYEFGPPTTHSAEIALNTAKISYTDAAAVSANTAKISYTDALVVSGNTTDIGTNATAITGKEDSLPAVSNDGDVLSSTIAGVRSWITPSGGGGSAVSFIEVIDTVGGLQLGTVADGTSLDMLYDTVDHNTDSGQFALTTNTIVITNSASQKYRVEATTSWFGTIQRWSVRMAIHVNGSPVWEIIGGYIRNSNNHTEMYADISKTLDLVNGDVVKLVVTRNSGNGTGNSTISVADKSLLRVTRL